MKKTILISLLLIQLLSISCKQPTTNKTTQVTTKENAQTIKQETTVSEINKKIFIDTSYNNLSMLIGGYPLAYYQPQWDSMFIKKFNANVKTKMLNLEYSRLSKIKKWNEENLTINKIEDTNFVFYPFSGGDFIHLAWLYPNANEYFMIARERIGDLPNLFEKDSIYMNQYLGDIEFVLRDIYNKSYFITKNMNADTKLNTKVNGMLPLILWGAIRTGHEINNVRFGHIDEQGKFNPVSNHKQSNIVEITMWNKLLKKQQKVTYFCCDLANEELLAHPENSLYISQSIGENCNTFIKSASYLLHYKSFTTIKDFILAKSRYLVQDDTGIPFVNFNNASWQTNVFGQYEKPVRDFSDNLYQEDLDSAYHAPSYKGELDFSLGYHWGSKKQNQLIAVKINNTAADPQK